MALVKIPEDVIEQVRSQVNIVDVVSQYVQLSQSGKNLFGLCPFHEERTPSFSVNEDKQIFHCFSCGRGGNVFKFLMEIENISFPEAVRKVATMQNIQLDDKYLDAGNSEGNQQTSSQSQLIDLHEQAVSLYHHVLINTKLGQEALQYIKNRGLTDETIEKYKIGFAPTQRLLKPFFEERKIDSGLLGKSGLFSQDDQGNLYDRFVDRLMFPIRNESGQTIGFSGRQVHSNPDMPKYLNSPETEIFNKRKVLFNLDEARRQVRKNNPAILLEGFMDVISADQAGIHTGMASMGTSLTEQQVYDISRITNSVIICYDGDEPGQNAIKRAIETFAKSSKVQPKVVSIPDGLDPDEFIKQRGKDSFDELISHAEAPIDFELRFLKQQFNLKSQTDSTDYISAAIEVIAKQNSAVTRDLYLNQLAEEFKVDKTLLVDQLAPLVKRSTNVVSINDGHRGQQPQMVPHVQSQSQIKRNAVQIAEARLMNRMLNDHDIWLQIQGTEGFSFVDEEYQMLYLLAEGYFTKFDEFSVANFSNFVKENSLQSLLIEIDTLDLPENVGENEIQNYIDVIMKLAPIESQLKQKRAELREASTIGDVDRQRQLTIEIVRLEQQKQASQRV
ncbi:DNA primase [Lentilactobacillus sp. Marseille-Q4993]|uniref:DNA primase n=1 Tax=Lentilactobacillus sp. Marseille-Q4993 TaxID=3039492 RepID=UPI0024BC5ECA|nr:DNA primase [Lentilactobacillus sp. Marseille-Q4993]